MHILVSGGAGYLGSVVVARLLFEGHKVTVLDKCIYGAQPLILFHDHPGFRLVRGDVRSEVDFSAALLQDRVDAIVHLAALVGETACSADEALAQDINFSGTQTALKMARQYAVGRLIFSSTCSNYGISEHDSFADEKSSLKPLSRYAEAKVSAEKLLLLDDSATCVTIFRLATLCGLSSRMRFDLLLNEMARAAALKDSIEIFSPSAWRPFLHVRDAARAISTALEAAESLIRRKVYNVVGENAQKQDLVDLVLNHYPKAKIRTVNKAPDSRDYKVSGALFASELEFFSLHSIEQAFLETAKAVEIGVFLDPKGSGYSAVPDCAERLRL